MTNQIIRNALLGCVLIGSAAAAEMASPKVTSYKTTKIDGLTIAYREAGDPASPKLVLLHGFPASSHQYRDLIPALATRFHVIAPDYPGFGFSSQPSTSEFTYTFDNLANLIEAFIDTLGITKLSMYVQD